MSRKDPQKRAVYKWGWAWTDWNRRTLTWRRTKRLIRAACKTTGVPPPVIKKVRGSYSYYKNGEIGITKGQRNIGVALHEAAHYITQSIYGKQPDGAHGKRFVGIWIALLVHFSAAPRSAIESSLRAYGVHWTHVKKKGRIR